MEERGGKVSPGWEDPRAEEWRPEEYSKPTEGRVLWLSRESEQAGEMYSFLQQA